MRGRLVGRESLLGRNTNQELRISGECSCFFFGKCLFSLPSFDDFIVVCSNRTYETSIYSLNPFPDGFVAIVKSKRCKGQRNQDDAFCNLTFIPLDVLLPFTLFLFIYQNKSILLKGRHTLTVGRLISSGSCGLAWEISSNNKRYVQIFAWISEFRLSVRSSIYTFHSLDLEVMFLRDSDNQAPIWDPLLTSTSTVGSSRKTLGRYERDVGMPPTCLNEH